MTALLWLGGVLGALVVIALGLRAAGASRWAELIRTHTRQLEFGRVNVQSLAQSGQSSQAASTGATASASSKACLHPCNATSAQC